MKKLEYVREIYKINKEQTNKLKEILKKTKETLNHNDNEEIERIYILQNIIKEHESNLNKIEEQIQILEEEEKINEI